MTRDDAAEIKRLLNQDLEGLISRFWPGAMIRPRRTAHCMPAGPRDLGSFVVYLGSVGKYHRGEWQHSSKAIGGDELNLFAYGNSGQRSHRADKDTFADVRRYLNLDTSRPETDEDRARRAADHAAYEAKREADERRAREHEQRRTRSAAEIWAESVPIAGTHAEAYLLARGLLVPPEGWGESLRFNRRVLYDLDDTLSFPTLVCRVDDAFGDLTAIWKIHLDPTKPTKAPVDKAKIGAGVAAGGAVRLGGIGPHIGLGEGVETCLAARALIKYRYPVWAGLSTAGVSGFEPPIEIEHITAWPDGDRPWRKQDNDIVLAEPAGRAAVRKLRERMTSIGMKFDAQPEPRLRQDYLDIWCARRRAEALA
jgi:hypothetical protein